MTEPTHLTATRSQPAVWPAMRARDARALIRFLTEALGFRAGIVVADGDEVAHAELYWPLGGGVMLGSGGSARDGTRGPDDPWPVRPGSAGTYLVTREPDALFERAVAGGADVVSEPHDTEYGSREFCVRDPEGNLWQVGTYAGEPPRE
jgi:uncharacterized glyoxalase superfamily protein PhnB